VCKNITKAADKNDKTVRAIDKDALEQNIDAPERDINAPVADSREERYQFTWPGKQQVVLLAGTPVAAALRPCREESVNFDATENLYIEGDNLEALKLLRATHLNRVKMIYIDPPYNTGNDFVYKDNFTGDANEFSRRGGQFDKRDKRLPSNRISNSNSGGRGHINWLNMMYPRLRAARDLLTEDGAVFISIDDNEAARLIMICDEIFGGENFVAQIPWRKRTAKSDVPFGVSRDYEWVVVYARSKAFSACVEGGTRKYYETEDLPNRPWRIHDITTQRSARERPNSDFTMVNPKTGAAYPVNPNRVWGVTADTFNKYYAENRIVFPGDYGFLNISKPAFRYFKDEDERKAGGLFGFIPMSTKLPGEIGMSKDGTKEFYALFGNKMFTYPKPVGLIKYLIKAATQADKSATILDFFSGSATTAHAVMQLNAEDNGNRRFIMVQIPEVCAAGGEAANAGYATICEIGKERIRRAGRKIIEGAGLQAQAPDVGFRVFKLDSNPAPALPSTRR